MGKPRNDLTGKVFTYLTVEKYNDNGKWLCRCKCGNTAIVSTNNSKMNRVKSCGCFSKEALANYNRKKAPDYWTKIWAFSSN